MKPRYFVNFQSRQKTPPFETLPSEKLSNWVWVEYDSWRHSRISLVRAVINNFLNESVVLFSGETTLRIGRKVLDFIRYLLMEQKTRRKEKEGKKWLTSGGTRLRIQDALWWASWLREGLEEQCRSPKLPHIQLIRNSSRTRWYFASKQVRSYHSDTKAVKYEWKRNYVNCSDTSKYRPSLCLLSNLPIPDFFSSA